MKLCKGRRFSQFTVMRTQLSFIGALLMGTVLAAMPVSVAGAATPAEYQWSQMSPAMSPSPRFEDAMVWDTAIGKAVLFGGYGGGELGDTWTWDGSQWSQVATTTSPSPRGVFAMAYDAATGQVILFGGYGDNGALGDTWSFNGTNWIQLNPADSPSPRWNVSMTYDPRTQMIVLFGGYNDGTIIGDTWNWNGSNWIQQAPNTSPSARYGDMIGYNASLGAVVLFGGQTSPNGSIPLLSDTWEWDGKNWSQINSTVSPGGRSFAAMDQDEGVLFGDDGGPIQVHDCPDVTTWQLTSPGWGELSTSNPPPGRSYPVMVYDPIHNDYVMFGGTGCTTSFLGDTWVFAGPSTTNPLPTTTSVAASMNPAQIAKTVTYTATVRPAPDGGTVTFYDSGSTIAGCTSLSPSIKGNARCPVRYGSTGSHSITASYSGDSNYEASTSPALSETVDPASTATTLRASANPATVGKTVTYTATVRPAPDGGTVTFYDSGSTIAGCTSLSPSIKGNARCPVRYGSTGSHSITASYSGDSNYEASTSPALSETVDPASTATTLRASANPATVGKTVTYTATVRPAPDGGTVTFYDSGSTIAGCTSLSPSIKGNARCPVRYGSTGSHSITASYSGDSNYEASTSPALSETVDPASTATTLRASANPATVGKTVTYTATVRPAPDGGTVTFYDSGSTIAGCTSLSPSIKGNARCPVRYGSTGSHSITASYSGDSNYEASTSPALSETVDPASTATTLRASANPATVGKTVTYTAKVSPIPDGGTVIFTDGGSAIVRCRAVAVAMSTGRASCKVMYSSTGIRAIRAKYSGDGNYGPSTSRTVRERVTCYLPGGRAVHASTPKAS